jgi:hypothetical protein
LCDSINQCTAFYGETFFPLGSERYRVCGYRDGTCVIAAFREIEGGGEGSRCLVPLQAGRCAGGRLSWSQIADRCTPTFHCNVQLGDCPTDTIACSP